MQVNLAKAELDVAVKGCLKREPCFTCSGGSLQPAGRAMSSLCFPNVAGYSCGRNISRGREGMPSGKTDTHMKGV